MSAPILLATPAHDPEAAFEGTRTEPDTPAPPRADLDDPTAVVHRARPTGATLRDAARCLQERARFLRGAPVLVDDERFLVQIEEADVLDDGTTATLVAWIPRLTDRAGARVVEAARRFLSSLGFADAPFRLFGLPTSFDDVPLRRSHG